MTSLTDRVIDAMSELDEHGNTLRALGDRLASADPEAAYSVRLIAGRLWELQKELSDERER